MHAAAGDIIIIRHYSLLNVFKSTITEAGEESIALKISREQANAYFFAGDPIVLAFPGSDSVKIIGGRVNYHSPREAILRVRPDIQKVDNDVRQYERNPVSHYADIRMRDTGKKWQVLVKDISFYGLLIFTKAELNVGQQMDVDIFLDRDIISFRAETVRRLKGPVHLEYGLKILHRGPLVFNHIQNYVRKSQDEYINAFNRK